MSRLGTVRLIFLRSGVPLTSLLPLWGIVIIGFAGAYGVLGVILLLEYFGVPALAYMHMR